MHLRFLEKGNATVNPPFLNRDAVQHHSMRSPQNLRYSSWTGIRCPSEESDGSPTSARNDPYLPVDISSNADGYSFY